MVSTPAAALPLDRRGTEQSGGCQGYPDHGPASQLIAEGVAAGRNVGPLNRCLVQASCLQTGAYRSVKAVSSTSSSSPSAMIMESIGNVTFVTIKEKGRAG